METLPLPCPRCLKSAALCVCAAIEPIANRHFVLILQHPQEQDRDLGSAGLATLHFQHAALKIGLSWPNLAKALGRPVEDPKRWAVLYLGSATLPDQKAGAGGGEVILLDRHGRPDPVQDRALATLDGVVVLDGTWSQAKALWWRNAWLLKLRRIVLKPATPSRYGKLRAEPRRESVATIEALAILMSTLEARPDLRASMVGNFEALLRRYRDNRRRLATPTESAPLIRP